MADAADLKSVVRKDVRVRLPPSAPILFLPQHVKRFKQNISIPREKLGYKRFRLHSVFEAESFIRIVVENVRNAAYITFKGDVLFLYYG